MDEEQVRIAALEVAAIFLKVHDMDGEADRWAKVKGFTDEDTTRFKAAILDIAHEHLREAAYLRAARGESLANTQPPSETPPEEE